jgi:hypothetical protein
MNESIQNSIFLFSFRAQFTPYTGLALSSKNTALTKRLDGGCQVEGIWCAL